MSNKIPPPPLYAKTDQPVWLDWFVRVANIVNETAASQVNDHQALQNLQGGNTTERYHLSASQYGNLTGNTSPPFSIAVGASPFSYQNSLTGALDVIVQGGTVSLIEFSRNGSSWYSLGVTQGMFHLSPSDYLRVTYSSAPTMTGIPRGYL